MSPRTVVVTLLSFFVRIYLFFSLLPQELSPLEDQGVVFSCTSGSEDASLKSLSAYTEKVEKCFKKIPESNGMWSITTSGSGIFVGTTLIPWSKRQRSQSTIISDLRTQIQSLPGARSHIFPMGTLLAEGQGNLQFVIKTSSGYAELEQVMDNLVTQLKRLPGFESVSQDLLLNTPQIKIKIDRAKAAIMGVTIDDISRTLETMLGGSRPSWPGRDVSYSFPSSFHL